MTRRIVGWLVLLPLCATLIVFALANRQWVQINFDPLTADDPLISPLQVPLFAVVYGALLTGIVLGGAAVWITQGQNRRENRQLKRESDILRNEVEDLRRRPPAKGLPVVDDMLEIE